MTYTQEINILIAQTLEKLQDLNPDLYGEWYTKLYQPHGHSCNWNVKTLHLIEQEIINQTK